MAARRKASARRKNSQGSSSVLWFFTGLLIGLGGAAFLFAKGYMPGTSSPEQPTTSASVESEPELLGGADASEPTGSEPRYDFFTVLPEMEVVVPERELSAQAEPVAPEQTPASGSAGQFYLQVGSFQDAADAEQRKARLALLGSVANVQKVTVNNQTWHRVRIGPVQGARAAEEIRRQLEDNGIDVMVLRDSS